MACRFEITLVAEDGAFVPAARTALDEVDRLEDELSVFREMSVVSELNRRAALEPVVAPRHLIDLLALCQRLHRDTGGAFDITTTPLSRCWGFLAAARRGGRLPDSADIDGARALLGLDAVELRRGESSVRFRRPGIELNLGAVGKGYALDRVSSGLRRSGVTHALLCAGGSSLLAVGGRGHGWRIDVISPLVPGQSRGIVAAERGTRYERRRAAVRRRRRASIRPCHRSAKRLAGRGSRQRKRGGLRCRNGRRAVDSLPRGRNRPRPAVLLRAPRCARAHRAR